MVPAFKTMRPLPPQGPAETPAEREARVRREAEIIAQAYADIDAGRGIEEHDL